MFDSYEEWLSLAMLRGPLDKLTLYLDPENLTWDQNKSAYKVQGRKLKHSGEQTFTINKGLSSNSYHTLDQFPQELIELLYSRKQDELPEDIKSASIWLPQKGILRPCGRNNFNVNTNYNNRASRGIAHKVRNPSIWKHIKIYTKRFARMKT